MLEKIVQQKTEPVTIVLNEQYNIVYNNSKANSFLNSKTTKEKFLQLSKNIIEQSLKNKTCKICDVKLNRRIISLRLELLKLPNDSQTYYLIKVENDTKVQHIDHSKINLNESSYKKLGNQENLTESEKKFEAIFYNALNFMARLSITGIVLEHNRYGHRNTLFDYIKNLIGKPIWTDKYLDETPKEKKQIKKDIKICAGGNIVNNEIDYYFKRKANPVRLKYSLNPIFGNDNKVKWILLEGVDISNLKNAQDQLCKSLEKSEFLFENNLIATAIVSKNLKVLETNKEFVKITGYTALEVNTIGYYNLLYKKDVEKAKKNYKKITTAKLTNARFKRRFVTKTKQLKTATFSFMPFYENKQFSGGIVTISDITELEVKRQQLNDNIRKYKSLFDNNVAGLTIGDRDGNLLKVNKAFCDILGYKSRELLQMSNDEFSCSEEESNYFVLFNDLLSGKIKKFSTTKKFVRRDNRVIDTIINVSGVFNEENEFLYYIASISDISEIKKLEAQLANKVVELEKYIESNLELENFAFLASHDLRAPLVTVLSFTKILQASLKGKINKSEYNYLGHISSGINRLQHSINDLLDFSSVSNNQLKITSINTKMWLNSIFKDCEVLIKSNNAKIIIKKIPQKIDIDVSLYTRLIYNLISNSIKFIKPNTIPKIEIGCVTKKNIHQFYVKDNGIGISKKMHQKVFGIFKRLHPVEVYKGTGIGLALCKKVVERHNGQIWIDSSKGKGTTFYFTLPV